MRYIASAFLLAIAPLLLSAQSPWARSKAGFYAQLGYHTIPTYGTLFGTDGTDIEMIREVSESTVQLYGEYGITSRTTAVVSLPYRFNSRGARNPNQPLMFAQEDTGSISGMGNASLAVRHQFLTGKLALSGTLRVDLPSSKSQPSAGLRTGFDAVTVQPTVSVGQGLGKAYWFGYAGYAIRTNDYSHFANAGVEAGLAVGPVWIIAFADLVASVENGARPSPRFGDTLTGLYENNQGWLSPGIKGIWQINRFVGLVVSAGGAAWAQYVPKSPGLGAAVYVKWD